MTHLLPLPSEVAVGVPEDQADQQLRQRMARLGGQRLPLRRLRHGVGRVAEQIELTCIAVRMAMSGRRARHGHLPDSCKIARNFDPTAKSVSVLVWLRKRGIS